MLSGKKQLRPSKNQFVYKKNSHGFFIIGNNWCLSSPSNMFLVVAFMEIKLVEEKGKKMPNRDKENIKN